MKWLWDASEFVRKVRSQLRFGERSHVPLRLLRLELRENTAECEWLARANDLWDVDLPSALQEENETFQALRDALTVREFLFASFPKVRCAEIRVYRQTIQRSPELIIAGTVNREDQPSPRIRSLVMQAKLCGLRFSLSDGALGILKTEDSNLAKRVFESLVPE